ncbi:hypothetical protein SNE40_004630 [Patella caerulea]|uniref:Uncharacterized protein n=1 Tax=Patella caerulea TaxID=87958 RepID=A0AAN8KCB7_PATCE
MMFSNLNNVANTTNFTLFNLDVNSTMIPPTEEKGIDALLYIIIVLMFYAFSIVILMVKYIRREREEANLRLYYREFVSRDKFHSAQFENKQYMTQVLNITNASSFVNPKKLVGDKKTDSDKRVPNVLIWSQPEADKITIETHV